MMVIGLLVAASTGTLCSRAEVPADSANTTVSVVSACAAEHIIPDGALASVVGTVFSSTTVTIMGQFIVDEDVLFQNCQVYMEAGAGIVVLAGRTLDVMNSSVTSCQQVMWKGITAQGGSTVRMRGSFVDDAENAITALDGSTLWLRDNQFHNNRVAVQVPEQEGVPWNNVAAHIRGNTFYSQGPMPQPYPGQATAVGAVGFAALDVHNTTLHLTGGENIIHTLSNGIVARRSNLEVIGWSMHGIQPDGAYAYTVNGAGIYAHGNNAACTLKQEGYGQGGSDPPSFVDCHWGIYAEYMNVHSTDNLMLDMGTAYRVDRSGYREVDILRNRVECRYHGMDLRFNDGAAHVLIEDNDITFGNDASCTACKGYTAIRVSEGNIDNSDSKILGNTIHFLPQNASRFGIFMNAANDWLVAGNTLQMAHNGHNRTGIQLHGCNRPEVSCNSVKGGGNGYPQDAQAAIRNMLGNDVLISCNDVDSTANGILFNGVTPNTEVRGNFLRNHKWGLHLDGTAVIGLQELKGNLWYNAAATGGVCALYEDSTNAVFFPFRYNPAVISGGNTEPPSWVPSNWFVPWSLGPNYDCADDEGEDYCSQFNERGKERLTELDVRVANDSLQNDPYTDETKWMLKGSLYKKLDEDPELQDSLTVMAEFYAAMQGSTTAAFKAIDDEQLALYDIDSSLVSQLQENRGQIDSLLALVQDGLEQLSDSMLTSAHRQAVLDGISGYRESIRDLSHWNAMTVQEASASKVLAADGVKAANSGVIASELIEANAKTVNDAYLATIGKDVDAFTVDQASTLLTIADQCPMLGGNAVFKARSLYWLINASYDFDDVLLCLPYGIIVKNLMEQHANALSVAPNPAGDEATLVLTRESEVHAYLTLYNTVGSEVLRVLVPKGVVRQAFSTASITPGLYHYTVVGGDGLVGVGKLTIVR